MACFARFKHLRASSAFIKFITRSLNPKTPKPQEFNERVINLMNADEALKCLNLAKQAITARDFEKAERFLVKSIKLHETSEA